MTQKKNQITGLSSWEWTTLVASWRYFEYRNTIASASFPGDIIERFWASHIYSDDCLTQIARQFADVDHHLHGEDDWAKDNSSLSTPDNIAWCKFYAFCRAWLDGFKTVVISDGEKTEEGKAFRCNYTQKWYMMDDYIMHPDYTSYINEDYIKEVRDGE